MQLPDPKMRVMNYTGFRFGNVLETALFAVDYLGYLANAECASTSSRDRLNELLDVRVRTTPPIYFALGQWTNCIMPLAFSKPDRVSGEVAVSIEVYARDPR